MWNGIANLFFGSASAEQDTLLDILDNVDDVENFEEVELTVRPAEEDDWFLVERSGNKFWKVCCKEICYSVFWMNNDIFVLKLYVNERCISFG